jgi:hypothetical protein
MQTVQITILFKLSHKHLVLQHKVLAEGEVRTWSLGEAQFEVQWQFSNYTKVFYLIFPSYLIDLLNMTGTCIDFASYP